MYALNLPIVLLLIFFDKRKPSSVLLWSAALLLLPPAGLLFYIFFGRGPVFGAKKRFLRVATFAGEKPAAPSAGGYEKYEGFPADIREMIDFNAAGGAPYSEDNSVEIYSDTLRFYADVFSAVENAREFVHAQFFIIKPDAFGKKLLELLARKAAEGVDVKLLYDDFGCMRMPVRQFDRVRRAGAKVYAFFPSFPRFFNRNVNYRNHRKIVAADGAAFTGGSNIGAEYAGGNKRVSPWIDCNIRLEGGAAEQLNIRFLRDFSFAAKKDYLAEHGRREYSTESRQGNSREDKAEKRRDYGQEDRRGNGSGGVAAQVLSDGPDTAGGAIERAYIKAIYAARERVYIETPYLIPDEAFVIALETAVRSGADVRIVLPGLPDKRTVYAATLSYAADLVEKGVKVYIANGFMHSKTMLIDDGFCSIGTFNIDYRSFFLMFENTVFLYDKAVCARLYGIIARDMERGLPVSLSRLKRRALGNRLAGRLMRLFTPVI